MSMLIIATAFSSGKSGWFDVVGGAQQPEFFARESQKQDAALLFRLAGEPARQFDHARSAGRVVVRAGVDRAGLEGASEYCSPRPR